MDHRREIDGLRALAVLPVIIFHANADWMPGGFVGVDIFFVISGFLITSIIFSELQRGNFTIANFYERRVRRIMPALLVVIIFTLVMGWFYMMPAQFALLAKSAIATLAFVSNLFQWKNTAYFGPSAELNPLLHTWSLAIEEQFYVFFPILMICLFKFARRWTLSILTTMLVLSIGMAHYASIYYPTANFYILPTRAWELLLGAVIAIVQLERRWRRPVPHTVREAAGALGVALIVGSVLLIDQETPFPSLYGLYPTIGAALVIAGAQPDTLAGRLLGLPVLVGIGLISYSAYLWHQPLLAFQRLAQVEDPELWRYLLLFVVLLLISFLSWRYVELPFRNRKRMTARQVYVGALSGTATAGILASLVWIGGGFQSRINPEALTVARRFDEMKQERSKQIRNGTCHVPLGVDLATFFREWDCRGSGALENVLVVGDSLAADMAMGFRSAGMDIGQLTANACSLSEASMSPRCHEIFSWIGTLKQQGWLRGLVLTGRLNPGVKTTGAAVASLERFWARFGVPIFLMSSKPEFGDLPARLTRLAWKTGETFELLASHPQRSFVSLETADASYSALRDIRHPLFTVVESAPIYCALSQGCTYASGGEMLTPDGAHLTTAAAGTFMTRILETPEWRSFTDRLTGISSASISPSSR